MVSKCEYSCHKELFVILELFYHLELSLLSIFFSK